MSIPLSKFITISGSEDSDPFALNALSERIQSPILSSEEIKNQSKTAFQYCLYLNNDRLELRSLQDKKQGVVCIDFLEGKTRHRRLYGGGKGQDLAKAIGIKKIPHAKVIDATAGLGRDAFVLASIGCHVTLLERNSVIYSLLKNALERVEDSEDQQVKDICSRMKLINKNASEYFLAQKKSDYADVIYLDPMFPSRKKTAKVKKEMSYFHDIVGEDQDSDALLRLAINCAHKRIVVKRPRLAEVLAGLKAPFSITGKSTRYDVYLPNK
jgi:16S rRNA (guanine1516-N2)-methyltransferase